MAGCMGASARAPSPGPCLRILDELLKAVDEVGSVEGVAANAHLRSKAARTARKRRSRACGPRAGPQLETTRPHTPVYSAAWHFASALRDPRAPGLPGAGAGLQRCVTSRCPARLGNAPRWTGPGLAPWSGTRPVARERGSRVRRGRAEAPRQEGQGEGARCLRHVSVVWARAHQRRAWGCAHAFACEGSGGSPVRPAPRRSASPSGSRCRSCRACGCSPAAGDAEGSGSHSRTRLASNAPTASPGAQRLTRAPAAPSPPPCDMTPLQLARPPLFGCYAAGGRVAARASPLAPTLACMRRAAPNAPTHRHDPDLALAGLDDARAVRPDQPRLGLPLHRPLHLDLRTRTCADAQCSSLYTGRRGATAHRGLNAQRWPQAATHHQLRHQLPDCKTVVLQAVSHAR
jgi:hypothetical protein